MDIVALITAISGMLAGGGLYKVYDRYFSAKKYSNDSQLAYRQELKQDVRELREEMNRIQNELIESNKNYITLLMEHGKLQIMYENIKNENNTLRQKVEHLESRLDKK
jgi:competence protein ComGF